MNKKYLIQRGIHFFPQVFHLDIKVFICVYLRCFKSWMYFITYISFCHYNNSRMFWTSVLMNQMCRNTINEFICTFYYLENDNFMFFIMTYLVYIINILVMIIIIIKLSNQFLYTPANHRKSPLCYRDVEWHQ